MPGSCSISTFVRTLYGLIFLVLAGCSQAIVVEKSDPDAVEFNYSVFANHQFRGLAVETKNFLGDNGLWERFLERPDQVITTLYQQLGPVPERQQLELIADLCYNQAKVESCPEIAVRYYLTAAQVTYDYLFHAVLQPRELPYYTPMVGIMGAYYNNSTLKIFDYLKDKDILLDHGYELIPVCGPRVRFQLPLNLLHAPLADYGLWESCANWQPRHQVVFSFRRGLGVPLLLTPPPREPKPEQALRNQVMLDPTTLFLRFDHADSQYDYRTARLEFIDAMEYDSITANGKNAPLALDITTTLAYGLNQPSPFRDIYFLLNPDKMDFLEGLYFATPWQPNKIPVVFTHGLMSNPRTWAQMLNGLSNDPRIRKHYQFWLFAYPTGNPVLYSAALLRKALQEAALRYEVKEMVLIGHSMGGLLSKNMVLNSGDHLAATFLNETPNAPQAPTPEQREALRDLLFFEALPYVKRVIFIATPHRGSKIATWSLIRWVNDFITVSSRLNLLAQHVFAVLNITEPSDRLRIHTGIGNLAPNALVLEEFNQLPIAAVPYHTISGNQEMAGVPGGTDGVVPYSSSHLNDAVSELVIRSNHSVHQKPAAIAEVKRLLIEHLIANGRLNPDGTERDTAPVTAPNPAFAP